MKAQIVSASAMKVALQGRQRAGNFEMYLGKGLRVDPGFYRFEGTFKPSRLQVMVQVASPQCRETVPVEVMICETHDEPCPEDAEGCVIVRKILQGSKWNPVVSGISRDHFYVNIWRRLSVTADGDCGVSKPEDVVRDDVDFDVMAMEI